MNIENSELLIETVTFYPNNFFNKTVNEPFIQMLMQAAFPNTNWQKGDPNRFEPDYFCNETPFEFTIASNRNIKHTFVAHLIDNKYTTDNLESDVFSFIRESIDAKALKNYSVMDTHLCILCLLDMFSWVTDEYGSYSHYIVNYQREEFFKEIKKDYILTKIFSNIFILFPDIATKWWIWDILLDIKFHLQLSDEMIKSGEYPYVMLKDVHDRIFAEENW